MVHNLNSLNNMESNTTIYVSITLNMFSMDVGESHVKMKGCFTDNACNNTECIDTSTKKMNFCCCTGHMCNSKYKWIPTTTKPPKREENCMLNL